MMTKWQLFNAMATDGKITVNSHTKSPLTGIIDSIQRESGDGSSFNVTLRTYSNDWRTMVGIVTVFVRTID